MYACETGRANAGKSTLLNAVIGRRNLLFTSKKAGRTQTLNFFRVGGDPGRLVVVDSPGYGARGRPEWGAVFDDYIRNRNEYATFRLSFDIFGLSRSLPRSVLGYHA